jgi:hypothetical protein
MQSPTFPWLFGSNPAWKCHTDADFLTMFNPMFPLPHQNSWTVFCLNCKVATHVISALWTKPFALDNWRQLPRVGRHVGKIGAHVTDLWGWIRTLTTHPSKPKCAASPALHSKHKRGSMEKDNKSRVALSLRQSRPLNRQSLWPKKTIPQRYIPNRIPQHGRCSRLRRMFPCCWWRWNKAKAARHMKRSLEIWR